MANTSSAQKAIRSQKKKASVNVRLRSAFRDARKAVVASLSKKGAKNTAETLSATYKKLDKAAKKGAISPKTAARYKSRLTKKVNKQASAK